MTDNKPTCPEEWAAFYITLADFGKACGGFHASDPVKAEAMARVFNEAADMMDDGDADARRSIEVARDFAADLVTRARKPLGRYTTMDHGDALAMMHRVAAEELPGEVLVIVSHAAVADLDWGPSDGHLGVIGPRNVGRLRGISARFCLVAEWPPQDDWHHVEMAVREGAAQIVMTSEPPYPIGVAP